MTNTYDPTAQVPDGIILDGDTYAELMQAWSDNDGEPLTDAKVESITGSALPAPTIKRSFPSGEHPNAGSNRFG